MYTWQMPDWPTYSYDIELHQSSLIRLYGEAQRLRGLLAGLPKSLLNSVQSEAYTNEGLANAAVEGEYYIREHVRSSTLVALGLADMSALKGNRKALAIGRLSIEAMQKSGGPLTASVIHHFHELAIGDDEDPRVGKWRTTSKPMYVISGAIGREEIHFEAPPSIRVPDEMNNYVAWYNEVTSESESPELAFVSSAIAHLYFETIHPYFDGNGRVGRAIAESALCKQLGFALPFSLSGAVLERKPAYYAALKAGSASLEINDWISFYCSLVQFSMERLAILIERTQVRSKVFEQDFNVRQMKVLDKLFENWPKPFEGGVTASKYMRMASTTKATATRDLQELLEMGILVKEGSGRGTRYQLLSVKSNN